MSKTSSPYTETTEYEAPAYVGKHDDEEDLWTEMLPGLWQGGTEDDDVRRQFVRPRISIKEFDTVVTLYNHANPVDWFVREIRYGIYDHDMSDFDVDDLFDIVKIAHSDWKRGKRVLIRCQAGWNRSGLITALVLIREGYDPADAISMQRDKRSPWVLCNRDFTEWLLRLNPEDWRGDTLGGTR